MIITVATILGCFILQTSVLPSLSRQGAVPNLMVIAAASYGFLFGDRKGIFIGMFCGLLQDIMFGPLIGFYAAVCALISFLAGKFQRILYVEDLAFPLTMAALSDLLYGFLVYVFLFMMRNRLFFGEFFLSRMLPEMILTVIAAIVLFPALQFLYNRFMRPRPQAQTGSESVSDG